MPSVTRHPFCNSLQPPDRPEGDRVACPGEGLEPHVPAGGGGGHHVVTALVEADVVHIAARVTGVVEEHQVARPGSGVADPLELLELPLRGAADDLAAAGVTVDVPGEA